MPLKGKKPTYRDKRFKALFYGNTGVGKTTAAIQFPTPYLIDTEDGAQNNKYVDLINERNGASLQAQDFTEILNEVKTLATEHHDYKTLIIDPLTIVYNNLVDYYESKVGSDFGRHYTHANKDMKRLLSWILRLDMNVVITSHAKNEYGDKMNVLGHVPDCYKKLDYLFDLVIEVKKYGSKRVGIVKKTRIEGFKEDETFEFSYKTIAQKYGSDNLEKQSEALDLASEEQVKEIKKYIELMKIPVDVYEKWLTKANVETFEEMDSDKIQKCIDMLKEKIQ